MSEEILDGSINFQLPIARLDETGGERNVPGVSIEYAKGWNEALRIVIEHLEKNPKVKLNTSLTTTTNEKGE